ncbi:MAG: T9SS type A sorting domain-containing protein [Bacteroidota bacterium]
MKIKTILFIGLLPFTSFAQSLQLTAPVVNLAGPANAILTGHARVENIGGGLIDLTVVRTQNDTTPGHNSFYCWGGACFPSSTSLAPFSLPLFPSESDTTLEAKVDPRGFSGSSTVKYCFYDSGNPSDSVCVIYNYNFAPVGIDELGKNIALSTAVPNPADRLTSISYSGVGLGSRMVITNLLGSTIQEISLKDRQGAIVLATGELPNGIYIYTVWSEGRPVASKRLVVSHK